MYNKHRQIHSKDEAFEAVHTESLANLFNKKEFLRFISFRVADREKNSISQKETYVFCII